jgi:hypothetical protein
VIAADPQAQPNQFDEHVDQVIAGLEADKPPWLESGGIMFAFLASFLRKYRNYVNGPRDPSELILRVHPLPRDKPGVQLLTHNNAHYLLGLWYNGALYQIDSAYRGRVHATDAKKIRDVFDQDDNMPVINIPIQEQVGGDACGYIALAYAVKFAELVKAGRNPIPLLTNSAYDQHKVFMWFRKFAKAYKKQLPRAKPDEILDKVPISPDVGITLSDDSSPDADVKAAWARFAQSVRNKYPGKKLSSKTILALAEKAPNDADALLIVAYKAQINKHKADFRSRTVTRRRRRRKYVNLSLKLRW